jgi:HAE1 family hydrophobic/amphiphilic exporter-1
VNYIWGGDQENQSEGFGTLGFALLAAIILVYLVMVGLYDSFAHLCGLICHSFPLLDLLALALTNNTLNIFTILGVIMLMVWFVKTLLCLTTRISEELPVKQSERL